MRFHHVSLSILFFTLFAACANSAPAIRHSVTIRPVGQPKPTKRWRIVQVAPVADIPAGYAPLYWLNVPADGDPGFVTGSVITEKQLHCVMKLYQVQHHKDLVTNQLEIVADAPSGENAVKLLVQTAVALCEE